MQCLVALLARGYRKLGPASGYHVEARSDLGVQDSCENCEACSGYQRDGSHLIRRFEQWHADSALLTDARPH